MQLWDLQKSTYVGSAPGNSQENIFQSLPAYHAIDSWVGWLQSEDMLAT